MSETKTVYQIAPDGRYLGSHNLLTPGDLDPLETEDRSYNVFQVPGDCVEVEPPEVPEGKALYWRESVWILEDIPPESEPEPEPKPTQEERLAILDAEYGYQFSELVKALGLANLDNNIALIAELQVEYGELKEQYQKEREAILNG